MINSKKVKFPALPQLRDARQVSIGMIFIISE